MIPQHRLTLISARAGSGKTTVVSEWLHGHQRPSAWFSLDANDNDPWGVFALSGAGTKPSIRTTSSGLVPQLTIGAIALALSLAFGLGNRELAAEVTRNWYRRYKAERDAIDRDNRELDRQQGIETVEEYVRQPPQAIRDTGPVDVVRPNE